MAEGNGDRDCCSEGSGLLPFARQSRPMTRSEGGLAVPRDFKKPISSLSNLDSFYPESEARY